MEDFESLRCLKTLLFLNYFQRTLEWRNYNSAFSKHGISFLPPLSPLPLTNNKEKIKNIKVITTQSTKHSVFTTLSIRYLIQLEIPCL